MQKNNYTELLGFSKFENQGKNAPQTTNRNFSVEPPKSPSIRVVNVGPFSHIQLRSIPLSSYGWLERMGGLLKLLQTSLVVVQAWILLISL